MFGLVLGSSSTGRVTPGSILGCIDVHTLVVCGDHDTAVPPANSRLLRRAFAPPALSRSRPSPPASTRRERPPGSNPCSGTPRSPPRASKDTYLAARHRRIMARRGRKRALVAVQHSILIAVWHMFHQRHGLLRPRCELLHRTRRQGAPPDASSGSSTTSAIRSRSTRVAVTRVVGIQRNSPIFVSAVESSRDAGRPIDSSHRRP